MRKSKHPTQESIGPTPLPPEPTKEKCIVILVAPTYLVLSDGHSNRWIPRNGLDAQEGDELWA